MQNYSQAEIRAGSVFLQRMKPFIDDGMSFEEAGKAVLERDIELMLAVTADVYDTDKAKLARDTIGERIYAEVNAA